MDMAIGHYGTWLYGELAVIFCFFEWGFCGMSGIIEKDSTISLIFKELQDFRLEITGQNGHFWRGITSLQLQYWTYVKVIPIYKRHLRTERFPLGSTMRDPFRRQCSF